MIVPISDNTINHNNSDTPTFRFDTDNNGQNKNSDHHYGSSVNEIQKQITLLEENGKRMLTYNGVNRGQGSKSMGRVKIASYKAKRFKTYQNIIDHGGLFDAQDHRYKDGHQIMYAPPQDIYTAMISFTFLYEPSRQKDIGTKVILYGPVILGALLSAIFQLAANFHLYQIVYDMRHERITLDEPLCPTQSSWLSMALLIACVVTFYAQVAGDIGESFKLCQWIGNLPKWKKEDAQTLEELETGLAVKFTYEKEGDGVEYKFLQIAAGGITKDYRNAMYFVCAIKFVLEILLVIFGSAYVLYSKNAEGLILNSVAMTFISRMDNVAYQYVISSRLKSRLESIPCIGFLSPDAMNPNLRINDCAVCCDVFGGWILVFSMFTACLSLFYGWC
eukprot:g4998.t1